MWEPAEEEPRPQRDSSLLDGLTACLNTLLRCLCCLSLEDGEREGGQRLLSAHQEALGIEASASPPRLPLRATAPLPTEAGAASESGPLLKGRGPSSSSSSLPSSLPPMPLPFFPPPRHGRQGSAGSQHGSGGGSGGNGGGGNGGESPPAGASPTKQKGKGGSKLSLLEDSEDICPTCLDPYTEDNPKVLTRCNHHFHLPCLYEWLERSSTCPVCGETMHFEELL
ncbi:E3 ubiquitin- ligase [Chlorella sorokiniana]|jgi:RNA polymerase subunit RPABC4/transcription elongation factor Spt4|uniref:RING-type E3 ubiquitin transferase n=1 Tax=Chlorella sorokiniana TaxID=3076 RepID=A0A2P6TVA5_CHLSO|nr:E3 ubiquitin- ligase [Chlorella sorokiniana]|eukprot:PRW57997.1 E3 ubiquitin- ligase [Chlorella sorokiniana]